MQPHLDRPYADLDEADQEDNRAAARRMESVLAVAGLGLSNDPAVPPLPSDAVAAAIEAGLEPMAAAEHDGWLTRRVESGWSWGAQRDDAAKRHPSMVPYAQLAEREKDKDRSNVRHYPAFAERAGYRIVRLG